MSSTSHRLLPALLLALAGLAPGGSAFAADDPPIDTVDRWLLTSGDAGRIKVAAKNLVAEPGRPAVTLDLAAAALDAYLRNSAALDEDTAAWLVRALGASHSRRYRELVERAQVRSDKLARFAEPVVNGMIDENVAWTPDAVDPTTVRNELVEQKRRLPAPTPAQFADVRVGVTLQAMWPTLGMPDDIDISMSNSYVSEWRNRLAADFSPFFGRDVTQMVFNYRGLGRVVVDRYGAGWIVSSVSASSAASTTAGTSTLLLQQFHSELRSGDPLVVRRAARRMVDTLVDDESVLAEARAVILEQLAADDENMVDAMSLLCRALGQSSDAESLRVLERVSREARSGKLRRWAGNIAEQVRERRN